MDGQDKFDPFKCKPYTINLVTETLDYVTQDNEISDLFADLKEVLCIFLNMALKKILWM